MDWQYTNDRTVQLQWGYPHSSRCRFLVVLRALVQTMLPGGVTRTRSDAAICASPSGAARMSHGVATPLSAKFFETMLSTLGSRSGGATRTRPAVPPVRATLSMQLWQCSLHVPRRCLARVQRCLAGKRFSPAFGTASCRCSDGVSHTRRDVASPTSVTVHSMASIVEPGLGGGPTLALLRSFSQAEFTSPSPSWRLMED